MIRLLPAIHRLLVFLPALQEQHINRTRVGDIAVFLESLSDGVTNKGGGNVQCIERDDFGRLEETGEFLSW